MQPFATGRDWDTKTEVLILSRLAVMLLFVVSCHDNDVAVHDGQESPLRDACAPTSCAQVGKNCGEISDGCGNNVQCGSCEEPMRCGAQGTENLCELPCQPLQSVFFDLGETLVTADGFGAFDERPGVASLLTELRAAGMQLGVITTVPDGWTETDLRTLLNSPELLDDFDVVLLSSQSVSPPKPDPAVFLEAVSLLPVPHPVGQSLFVTEAITDIANQEIAPTSGARAAGMLGLHLSSAPPSSWADYTVAPAQLQTITSIAMTACAASI